MAGISKWGKIAIGIGLIGTLALVWALAGRNEEDKENKHDDDFGGEMMSLGPFEDLEPDWVHTQEEHDGDGNVKGETIFYGYDDGEGKTDWHDEDGGWECRTETPSEDSLQWEADIADGTIARV